MPLELELDAWRRWHLSWRTEKHIPQAGGPAPGRAGELESAHVFGGSFVVGGDVGQ